MALATSGAMYLGVLLMAVEHCSLTSLLSDFISEGISQLHTAIQKVLHAIVQSFSNLHYPRDDHP